MTGSKKIAQLIAHADNRQLVDYMGDRADLFKLLIDTYIQGPYRVTQRVAGAVTSIAETNASLLVPHLGRLIKALNDPHASTALKRNTVRMFQFVRIPAARHAQVMDACFRFLLGKKETIAVKVFSMSVLEILSHGRCEIRRELKIVLEDQLPYSGPAFRSRALKVIVRLSDADGTK